MRLVTVNPALKVLQTQKDYCIISCHLDIIYYRLTAKTLETLPILKMVLSSGASGLVLSFTPNPFENIT